ncbi:MAG: hypothetical protein KDB35_22925, partial [Acidimicrobiales bacterium]|nr:hypothetical protein [Acidimicrobiales bacterium]
GISPGGIGAFVATLTPVLLREDTRVTNHGFSDSVATPLQSVLQAGTAVLVDDRGVPRVRCACGNPLTEPAAADTGLAFTGDRWSGFDDTRLVAVDPAPEPLDTLTITDIDTGDTQDITTGTGATTDEVVLRQDGIGVAPFGTPADEAIAALTEALGPPVSEGGTACASGSDSGVQLLSWTNFSVEIGSESGLYLWSLATSGSFGAGPPPPPGLATPEGLGVGSTLAQFESTYEVTAVRPDALGNPINHHFVGDRFKATALDDGELYGLWAGSEPLSTEPAYGVVPSVCVWYPD